MIKKYKTTITYIIAIVVINTLFVYTPGIAAFGESFSPADMVVGSIYVFRDFAQREIKHYIFIAMVVGCLLSYFLASKEIAVASVVAFAVGEIVDWSIFTFTKKPLSQRLILSATISSPVDSYLFLQVAHRFTWPSFYIMVTGKIIGVVLLWLYWKWRASRQNVMAVKNI